MSTLKDQRDLLKNQRKASSKKRFGSILAAVLLVTIALTLTYYVPRRKVDGPSMGNPDAPVKVEVFSNFGCSYCVTWANENEADFIKDYVDTGKVYYTYHNYQFAEDQTTPAGEATYCAGEQNKFWEYKKLIYQNAAFAGTFTESSLQNFAKDVNLNLDDFDSCVASDRQSKNIQDGVKYGQMIPITGTPSFVVNGEVFYMGQVREAVDAALAKAGN